MQLGQGEEGQRGNKEKKTTKVRGLKLVMILAPEVLCPRRTSTNLEVRDGKGEDREERKA